MEGIKCTSKESYTRLGLIFQHKSAYWFHRSERWNQF